MIVADTNLISYLWIPGEHTELAEKVYQKDPSWISPLLWRSEFKNVLCGYIRNNLLSLEYAIEVCEKAESYMAGNEFEISSLEVLNLVSASMCSAYDCEFVALAQYYDIKVVTSDKTVLKNFPETAMSMSAFLIDK